MGKLPHILFFLILLSYSFVKGQKDSITTIHTFVALCDNENQGIYPVSKDLGNGQSPRLNLYWGALYGVKTHFRKSSSDWTYIKSEKVDSIVLERVFFKHKVKNVYLIADAYDGRYIKKCTDDFLKILNTLEGENVFIISHKTDLMADKFKNIMRFEKYKNFTRIVE